MEMPFRRSRTTDGPLCLDVDRAAEL